MRMRSYIIGSSSFLHIEIEHSILLERAMQVNIRDVSCKTLVFIYLEALTYVVNLIYFICLGKYVPELAGLIQDRNKDPSMFINLKGILVLSLYI